MTNLAGTSPNSVEQLRLARELADRFRSRGHDVYLVGGAVRDALLGRPIRELDFATSAPPSVTVEILESFGTRSPYRVGEKFGTIGYHSGELRIEITTYRSREVYQPGSRKPDVQFGRSLEEDLSRRDFTINAIAWDPSTDALIDPLGGIQDLLDGVIRAVGTAEDRFREDPLRLLRAVRFSAVLDFAIESETWRGILMSAPALESISRERLREEFTRLLESDHPSEGMGLLRDAGLLAFSVPQLLELTRMPDHGPRHPLSLWDHTMRVLQAVPPILVVRWAALLHDIAKPATRTYEANGRPRFFHHEELGAQMVRDILGGLRYPTTIVQSVA
ncbi:MAG TPA: HDIG domain-containing protein, partial [Chloroflexota bacterium]